MSVITIVNIVAYIKCLRKQIIVDGSEIYQKRLRILCGIYVIGCSFRALIPRIDVERICFFDTLLSCTFIGRCFATLAELSFMGQLSLVLYKISSDVSKYAKHYQYTVPLCFLIRWFAVIAFLMNVVAQTFCWLGVTTTYQLWHVYEESIWGITALIMSLCCLVLYSYVTYLPINKKETNDHIRKVKIFLVSFVVIGLIYVLYMFLVDVPLYYNRWLSDERNGKKYFSFIDGVKDATSCKLVTQEFDAWKDDLSWITGYFSVAVWISIWLTRAPRIPFNLKNE